MKLKKTCGYYPSAVQCATELLQLNSNTQTESLMQSLFSPIVVTALVRILSSFVDAGAHNASSLQRMRNKRRGTKYEDNQRMYLTFDKKDLGVAGEDS